MNEANIDTDTVPDPPLPDRDGPSPVDLVPTAPDEQVNETPRIKHGISLCLSGGGYRAMLFHVGALWRLYEADYLSKLSQVCSVSGGSITAGVLALAWPELDKVASETRLGEDEKEAVLRRVECFKQEVVRPLRRLASQRVDIFAAIKGLLGIGTSTQYVANAYNRYLPFKGKTLDDLPAEGAGPEFVILASNLQSAVLWRFSRASTGDYQVGWLSQPKIDLALAVAASSAFPPFLSPAVLHFDDQEATRFRRRKLKERAYTDDVYLTDGGVYDNLGLEPAWKRYDKVLVSDGGGHIEPSERPGRDWFRQFLRVRDMADNQVRGLRKRQLIASYNLAKREPKSVDARHGAFWGIRTDIDHYKLAEGQYLPCPYEQTIQLAKISTRLWKLDALTQERLINWGYAVCDAAIRKHVDPSLPVPSQFPYKDAKVGVASVSR